MPAQKLQRFQFRLKWLFALVLLVSLGSIIWAHFNPPLRLTEVGRYPIIVDYSSVPEEMFAAGKYDRIDRVIIPANFPIEKEKSGKKELEAIVINIDKNATSADIVEVLDRKGLRLATHRELLTFVETYPWYQRDKLSVISGLFWWYDGRQFVFRVIWWDGDQYPLQVHIWPKYHGFLVFAKSH